MRNGNRLLRYKPEATPNQEIYKKLADYEGKKKKPLC